MKGRVHAPLLIPIPGFDGPRSAGPRSSATPRHPGGRPGVEGLREGVCVGRVRSGGDATSENRIANDGGEGAEEAGDLRRAGGGGGTRAPRSGRSVTGAGGPRR